MGFLWVIIVILTILEQNELKTKNKGVKMNKQKYELRNFMRTFQLNSDDIYEMAKEIEDENEL